ncbi:iron chelate uptake ABC transporter family permease subunit [Shigella flexneri]
MPWRALLTDWQAGREHYYVLMEYRLPRLLLALFVGAALAVAGVLIRGLCATLWHHRIFSALTMPPAWPLWGLYFYAVTARDGAAAAGLAGGMAGLILLKMLAKTHQPMKLALTGVALSACWASLTDYLMLSRAGCEQRPAVAEPAAYGAVTGAL